MIDIAVIGAGYVGLVSAACLAELGHQVTCADIDPARVEALGAGHCPIHEQGLQALLRSHLESGRLDFVFGAEAAVVGAEVVLLCLPTPPLADGAADTSFVEHAVREIGPLLEAGAIVVTKSTVPVGTGDRLQELLGRADVTVASNPEFLREGTAVHDFMHPDRIVVGGPDASTCGRVASLYAGLDAPVVATDRRSAELIKYAANAFLATKLSFVNAVAALSEQVDADIDDVMHGIGSDPRIGPAFLRPGPGYGGSCFPKDTRELAHLAERFGVPMGLMRAVIQTNEEQFDRVAAKVAAAVGGPLTECRVAVLGLAFKAGTDDTRESPALHVIERLLDAGAAVRAHDPEAVAPHEVETRSGFLQTPSPLDALVEADVVVVATEWEQYRDITPEVLASTMAGRIVIDTRNLWDRCALLEAGFDVTTTGRARSAGRETRTPPTP